MNVYYLLIILLLVIIIISYPLSINICYLNAIHMKCDCTFLNVLGFHW